MSRRRNWDYVGRQRGVLNNPRHYELDPVPPKPRGRWQSAEPEAPGEWRMLIGSRAPRVDGVIEWRASEADEPVLMPQEPAEHVAYILELVPTSRPTPQSRWWRWRWIPDLSGVTAISGVVPSCGLYRVERDSDQIWVLSWRDPERQIPERSIPLSVAARAAARAGLPPWYRGY